MRSAGMETEEPNTPNSQSQGHCSTSFWLHFILSVSFLQKSNVFFIKTQTQLGIMPKAVVCPSNVPYVLVWI